MMKKTTLQPKDYWLLGEALRIISKSCGWDTLPLKEQIQLSKDLEAALYRVYTKKTMNGFRNYLRKTVNE